MYSVKELHIITPAMYSVIELFCMNEGMNELISNYIFSFQGVFLGNIIKWRI